MILHQLNKDEGLLHLEPKDSVSSEDIDSVRQEIDDFLGKGGVLNGILVMAPDFPGWKSLKSLLSHFEFVSDHHDKVGRVAILTEDSAVNTVAPAVDTLVSAELKTFAVDDKEVASEWVRNA